MYSPVYTSLLQTSALFPFHVSSFQGDLADELVYEYARGPCYIPDPPLKMTDFVRRRFRETGPRGPPPAACCPVFYRRGYSAHIEGSDKDLDCLELKVIPLIFT